MNNILDKDIQYIKGIGPKKAEAIKRDLSIETIEDFLYFSPRKYIDRSTFRSIRDVFTNEIVTVGGNIVQTNIAGKKRQFLEVIIDDGTDSLAGIFFNSLSYFSKIFKPGEFVLFSGKIEYFKQKQITHPEFDFLDETSQIKSINTGRVIPLYRSTEKLKRLGLDSRGFRRIIRSILDATLESIHDPVNPETIKSTGLMGLKQAVFAVHFPESMEQAESARRRLSYNELFFLQYYLCLSKRFAAETAAELLDNKNRSIDVLQYKKFIEQLPFQLTAGQLNSIKEIESDLSKAFPMNRLLQGDVGSGKTIVSIAAALFVHSRGEQTAFMAPTEVLANQHYETFMKFAPKDINIALLSGSTSPAEKKIIYKNITSGDIDIVIGTHALIQESVIFKKLGLIIIDEQHKFGVNQRAKLREKGQSTDLLIMTATPIPRSLSLTLYGDLDVSYIREKPQDRIPVKTMAFPESKIRGVYNSLEKYMSQGKQVFVVLPIIEESEKIDLKSAVEEYERLRNQIFPERRIGIMHGNLRPDEKEIVMQKFKDKALDVLVSTTVIEVGIDIPNATIMVIEHAERFGLSQLHQLRGRVGRGHDQSFCILIYPDKLQEDSLRRINTLVSVSDGFIISEEDLKMRGAGNIVGSKQHGHFSGFEFADITTDIDLIQEARKNAQLLVSQIDDLKNTFSDLQSSVRISPLLNGIRTKRVLSILS